MDAFAVILLLGLDAWALVSLASSGTGTGRKLLWAAGVLALPFLGFVLWFFLGPRAAPRKIRPRVGA